MSDTWIVIPAAGESRRFKEAGYMDDKPFLTLADQNDFRALMYQHILFSIPHSVPIKRIVVGTRWELYNLAAAVQIKETKGQADTVYQLVKTLPPDDSVLVLDCDTILKTEDITKLLEFLKVYDMVVAVAETFDPNASRVDQVPFPTRFVEKEPISQWGMISGRGFKSCGDLAYALRQILSDDDEPYLSTAMNYYPGTKYAHVITEYVDLGTPERIKEAGWKILS